jgi:hypothetical protein
MIGDLPKIDEELNAGLEDARGRASAWQSDAFLTSLRVGCELLEPAFRWQATFYSPSAQVFFTSDTGETDPAEVEPSDVPELPTGDLSFGLLHRALAKAGYNDQTELAASTGVDIQVNAEALPFGPPEAPPGAVLYHVAVLHRGEVRDLFVDSSNGTIYRYAL